MERYLKIGGVVIIVIGIFLGTRFVGSAIRYGCTNPVPLENVEGGDDCPPPFYLVGRLGWLATGGSLMPLWNRDATTVEQISWTIEKANPAIVSEDDHRFYEQKIAVNVTFKDGTTRGYDLGTARGCTGETKNEITDRKRFFGRVDCYFALSGARFAAFNQGDNFRIERYDESAQDGSVSTTTLVEIAQ